MEVFSPEKKNKPMILEVKKFKLIQRERLKPDRMIRSNLPHVLTVVTDS